MVREWSVVTRGRDLAGFGGRGKAITTTAVMGVKSASAASTMTLEGLG